jgi:LuxR family maltose regulon positive regulatory protein
VQVWLLAEISNGAPANLAAAAAKLAEYRTLVAVGQLPRRVLELDLLETQLCAQAEDHHTASHALQRAVKATQRAGAVRSFVDVGPLLIPYLQDLVRQGVETEHIGRILAAFPASPDTEAARTEPVAPFAGASAELLGPDALTNREVDVLLLLAARLSNKEIAEQLYISPFTVKRHTITIYQKLHVDSRRAAVARARAMGLLPAS